MKTVFSPTELQLIELLGSRKMTILELTEEFYKKYPPAPFNPNNVVSSAFNRINKKCEYYEMEWFINGQGAGRGGKTIWKEKRKPDGKKKTAKKK
ncbi:MAG: hypothetical protein ACKOX6_15875 [Bdellovibrio sp.]